MPLTKEFIVLLAELRFEISTNQTVSVKEQSNLVYSRQSRVGASQICGNQDADPQNSGPTARYSGVAQATKSLHGVCRRRLRSVEVKLFFSVR